MRRVEILVFFEENPAGGLNWQVNFNEQETLFGRVDPEDLQVQIESDLGTFRRSFVVALIQNALA